MAKVKDLLDAFNKCKGNEAIIVKFNGGCIRIDGGIRIDNRRFFLSGTKPRSCGDNDPELLKEIIQLENEGCDEEDLLDYELLVDFTNYFGRKTEEYKTLKYARDVEYFEHENDRLTIVCCDQARPISIRLSSRDAEMICQALCHLKEKIAESSEGEPDTEKIEFLTERIFQARQQLE